MPLPLTPRFVAYYRVSTQAQGRSNLGLAAQQEAVAKHIASVSGCLVETFQEVECPPRPRRRARCLPGAARDADHRQTRPPRPQLGVPALDRRRLGRRRPGFCDLPQVPPGPSGKFVVAIMAAVAELGAGLISARTKAALAQAKARGVKLGNPRLRAGTRAQCMRAAAAKAQKAAERASDVRPYIVAAKKAGCTSMQQLADALNARGIPSARGGKWHASTVWRVIGLADRPQQAAGAAA